MNKTGVEMRISDWRSDVGSSDLFLADVFAGDDGQHVPGSVWFHQLDVGLVHEGAVFDRVGAGLDRASNGLGTVRVGGHREAIVLGGGNDRLQFGDRKSVV